MLHHRVEKAGIYIRREGVFKLADGGAAVDRGAAVYLVVYGGVAIGHVVPIVLCGLAQRVSYV